MSTDIFQADFEVTPTTYIIAPGWEGRKFYKQVPKDAFTIAVNKGVQVGCHKNIWLVEDMGMLELHPWFKEMAEYYITLNLPIESHLPTPVFGKGKMTDYFPKVPYHYELGNALSTHPMFTPVPGVLRGGATIASKAVQLAFLKGAKKIVLVGVDMRGRKYFDGTETTSNMLSENGDWWCLHKWKQLLAVIRSRGVDVVSLSPTALDVKIAK